MSKPEDTWQAVTTEGKFVPQTLHSTDFGTIRALCSASGDFKGMPVVCDGPYDHSGAHFVVLPDKSLFQWREVPNT